MVRWLGKIFEKVQKGCVRVSWAELNVNAGLLGRVGKARFRERSRSGRGDQLAGSGTGLIGQRGTVVARKPAKRTTANDSSGRIRQSEIS